jgi:hypothetical protein
MNKQACTLQKLHVNEGCFDDVDWDSAALYFAILYSHYGLNIGAREFREFQV